MQNQESDELENWQPTPEGWEREDYPYMAYIVKHGNGFRWSIEAETYRGSYWEPPEYGEINSGEALTVWSAAVAANEALVELYASEDIW